MSQLLPPKKDVALALLERSNVDVYLDPRAKGVVVPPQFRKEPRLILKIGLNMPVPIPDLRLDDESMSCTLSFNRSPFYCVVPWPSVFAMVGGDGRGMVWPDDVPHELAVRVVDDRKVSADRESAATPSSIGSGRKKKREAQAADKEKDAEATELERPFRPKRGKKKKEERRPVLVAVPPPSQRASERGRDAPAPTPRAREAPGPAPRQPTRPKRELPPYLRVVK